MIRANRIFFSMQFTLSINNTNAINNTNNLKTNLKLPQNGGRTARDLPKIDGRAAETTVAYATARPLRYTPAIGMTS